MTSVRPVRDLPPPWIGRAPALPGRAPALLRSVDRLCVAEAWLLDDVRRPLSLGAVLRQIGVPRREIDRACRLAFGRSIAAYLRELRLHQIQWTLERGDWLDLSTAQRSAGYRSRRRFLQDYKAMFVVLPEKWDLERDMMGRLLGLMDRARKLSDWC